MWPTIVIVLYCALLITASLFGGWLPSMLRLTHTRMQLMMSLVGGLMLGVALLHLLPHGIVETDSLDYAARSCVLGLLTMFLIIRVFHVHQHGPVEELPDHDDVSHCERGHDHHDCEHPGHHDSHDAHQLSWIGLFAGLAIHSLLDGVAVGASLAAGIEHGATTGLIGFGTFLAVLLHKPLDSLSITSVMAVGNWSLKSQQRVNVLFSLICPVGAILTLYGVRGLGEGQHLAVGCALAFSAGVFLCISLADILPEIQFHQHDRVKLTTALLIGVAIAFAIGLFEPEHAHDRHASPATDTEQHDADQHDAHEHESNEPESPGDHSGHNHAHP